jgi:REP element-mobilizing transposase RayT
VIVAYHVVISAYGFWLPNEERGSFSDFVRKWDLFRNYGPATQVHTARSIADQPYDRKRREEARNSLKYPPVIFNGAQARAVARGFADQSQKCGYVLLAFAILREHAHFVIRPHFYDIDRVVNQLKGAATRRLLDEGLHPFANLREPNGRLPQVWARNFWKVFLYDRDDVVRSTNYTNENPEKEGLRRQNWSFVTPLDAL